MRVSLLRGEKNVLLYIFLHSIIPVKWGAMPSIIHDCVSVSGVAFILIGWQIFLQCSSSSPHVL